MRESTARWSSFVSRLRVATVLVSVCLVGCADAPAPERAETAWSIDAASAVYSGRRDGNADLYRSRAGQEPERLTSDPAQDNFPRVSPGGGHVAFQSRRKGGIDDIYLLNLTSGDAPVNLTDHEAYDVLPSWSPDGRRLAFMSTRGFELGQDDGPFPGHIYVINADGSGLSQLTREPLTSSLGPQDWTPDGVGLLLSRVVDGQIDLFRLDIVTGREARLTSDPAGEYGAAVSPDGTTIAFHAETDADSQLVLMALDGSNRRVVTSGPGFRYGPRWSPDGRWLAFGLLGGSGPPNQVDLRVLNLETGNIRPLVTTPEDEREADWIR